MQTERGQPVQDKEARQKTSGQDCDATVNRMFQYVQRAKKESTLAL